MKTQDEIVERYELRKHGDWLGFEVKEYFYALDLEHARPYFKEGADETKFVDPAYTDETVWEMMRDYMPFAREKADNERGISASRSILHYIAWIWLLGDDDFGEIVEREYKDNYHSYGKPILAMIEREYGFGKEK